MKRDSIAMKHTLTLLTLAAAVHVSAAQVPQPSPAPAPPKPSPVKEIVVVIKTHFDIGYTHRVKEIVHHYRTDMIDKAMNIMDQSKTLPPEQQFAWTGPGWVMSKVLDDWDGQTPERRRRLDDYVKAGKFQFHALPFTLESDACEPEEMARGFIFSSALCRKYGMPLPRSGKKTDVPSHGGALATVLAHGGVKFMHIGCNWPSGAVKTPGLFWWEGPDGSRVLTLYSNTYGTCVPPWMPRWYCDQDPFISTSLAPTPDWPYPVWPAILVTPDNSGPPKAEQVKALFEEATQKLPGVKIRMGTMDDFVDAMLKANPDIPVVKGEMPDTWIHGVMCDPGGIRLSREVHPQIAAAEALHTSLHLWGVARPPVAKEVALAYENILLYGEHTWGRAPSVNQYGDAFKTANPKRITELEASWEDKTDYIREASRLSRGLMAGNLQALAASVKRDAPGLVVYNPLPWTRSGTVEINGETVFVKDLPPCGYRTHPLPPASMKTAPRKTSEPATIANAFFKLTLEPAKGAITSLVEKRTGREWVDSAEPRGLGHYLNERFTFEQTLNYTVAYQGGRAFKFAGAKGEWPHPGMHKGGMISEKQVPYRAATAAKGVATIDGNSAIIECPADPANHLPATVLRITLPTEQPYIDLEITIKDKAKDNWPEADWLCLPFKIASPQFRVHRALGVMNPVTDILPGANRDLFSVGHGVTIADADGSGIAVCPLDHPLVSLDRPGCWRASKSADEFTPKKPVVYLNLYNNQWNTNFRYWYPGTWSSRVRLWTFDKHTAPDAIMATPALEARNPLLATAANGAGGRLPAEQSGLAVSRKGVLVTAFGQNPDGAGTLLRIWEMAGVSGERTVSLPGTFTSATPVNLRGERTGEPRRLAGSTLAFNLGAFAPATFVLE
jgi:alpha-mannosidase